MAMYLLKFSACLLAFWLLYVLFLERQKMHRFKRFYLLGSFVLAIIIPLLTITEYVEPIVQNFEITPLYLPIEASVIEPVIDETPVVDLATVLWLLYGLGAAIFSVRFILNLRKLYNSISKNDKIKNNNFIYVLLNQYRIPHSFFRYIFLHKTAYERNEIPQEVLLHEETHAKQLHSLDILAIELLQIVLWFHPLVYLLKHHIKLNHEFLADEAVLNEGVDSSSYQTILLQFSSNTQDYQLSSAINYSSIKKRFTVMKTQTSKTRIWLSSLLILPICAILFYSFAEREYVQKESNDSINAITEELKEAEKLNLTYVDNDPEIKHYTTQLFYVKDEESGVNVGKTFTELNDFYKRKWVYVGSNPLTKKEITQSEFNKLLDAQKYLVMIDGVAIENDELKKYSKDRFVTYSNSTISELAEMQQDYLYNLITEDGLDISTNLSLYSFNNALDEYNDLLGYVGNGSLTTLNRLSENYNFLQQLYERFPADIIKDNNLKLPALPSQLMNDGASEELMQEYRDFISDYKKTNIIRGEKYERARIIYDVIMSDSQRASIKKYPKRLIPEPNLSKTKPRRPTKAEFEDFKDASKYAIWIDAKHVSNSVLDNYTVDDFVHVTGSIVHKNARSEKFPQPNQYHLYTQKGFKYAYQDSQLRKYKKVTQTYSKAIQTYLKGSQTDNLELRILKAQADKIYKSFSKEEIKENNILPPPPVPAEKKMTSQNRNSKGGPNFEDIQNVYNPSFLEYIIEMGSKGATFYLDNVSISFDEAKRIAKDKNSVPMDMIKQRADNGNYIVKLRSSKSQKLYARSVELLILDKNTYLIDNIKATKSTFLSVFNQLHQDLTKAEREKVLNIHVNSNAAISDKEVWFIYNTLQDYGFYRIVTPNQEINAAKGNTPFAITNQIERQQNPPTKEEIASYNAWAKKMKVKFEKMPESEKVNGYPHMINDEAFRYHNAIYDRMTPEQKKKAVSLPEAVLVTEWPMPVATRIQPITKSNQEKATKKQITEYNAWAKEINDKNKAAKADKSNEYAIIKLKEMKYYKAIYDKMTDAQRRNAQPFPDAPPPPKPHPGYDKKTKKGLKALNIQKTENSKKEKKSESESKETKSNSPWKISTGVTAVEYIDSNNNSYDLGVTEYKSSGPTVAFDSSSKNTSEDYTIRFIILRASKKQTKALEYVLNGKATSATVIEKYIEDHPESDVSFRSGKTTNTLSFSDKKGDKMTLAQLQKLYSSLFLTYDKEPTKIIATPIKTESNSQLKELPKIYVNGNELINPKISLTKTELMKLKLTLSNGTVSNFKLKIPGIKTDLIKGNSISSTSIKNLENFDEGTIAIFDIKDDKNNKLPPIIIELKK